MGGIPVSRANRRMKVRRDSRLWSAIRWTVIGEPRLLITHSRVARRSERAGVRASTYWGSFAPRTGELTTSFAILSAAAIPKSVRTT
ncbi:hypothetical protein ACFV85_27800 [Streptomyces niveus]|uniref:hypothetical protein n=1 Tax=Streptomyces niveus TaxID=193462 RepID=UPI003652B9D7